ncbi:putative enzyme [Escherichia coli H305]|nr:putative enzyme [Escherichia coli H305]
MTNNECKGPFEGLLVIDMTHVLNGPFGTQLLCNMGARVIKVEPPGHGDDTRTFGPYVDGQSLYYSFINHGKESVVLDLKNDHDKSIFINMLKQADVDAPRDKCTLSCAINGIHAAFHYLKKNYISGCVMTVPTGW